MRRTISLFAAMAMMVLVAASVALAATVNCSFSGTCKGTGFADTINGGGGGNRIYGYTGDDRIRGDGDQDIIYGNNGGDSLYGNDDDDWLLGDTGTDRYNGGAGNDYMVDSSLASSDSYKGLEPDPAGAPSGQDEVRDQSGSSDTLDLRSLERSQVFIFWFDTHSESDPDSNRDGLYIGQLNTNNRVIIVNYFDNKGGTGKGAGAIETIAFKGLTDHRFPIPEG